MKATRILSKFPCSRSFVSWLYSLAVVPLVAAGLVCGCATRTVRAGDVEITSPTAEQTVGPEFKITWRPERVQTVVVHLEGNAVPVIKEYNKRSGETYKITVPGHYIFKTYTEGHALPEHEVWAHVAAEDPAAPKKTVHLKSPENGAEVAGWFPVRWVESDRPLSLVFYHADQPILKARGIASGAEFCLPETGLWEIRVFEKDRKVPVGSAWITVKPAPSE